MRLREAAIKPVLAYLHTQEPPAPKDNYNLSGDAEADRIMAEYEDEEDNSDDDAIVHAHYGRWIHAVEFFKMLPYHLLCHLDFDTEIRSMTWICPCYPNHGHNKEDTFCLGGSGISEKCLGKIKGGKPAF